MNKESFDSRPTEILEDDCTENSRATEIMDDNKNINRLNITEILTSDTLEGSRVTEVMDNESYNGTSKTEIMSEDINISNSDTSYIDDVILENKKNYVTIGDVIGSGYKLIDIIAENTGEAKIFLSIKDKKEFVVKIYHKNKKPKEDIINLLKTNTSPYVIKIIEDGEINGRYFEVQNYFSNKDLQSNLRISNDFIINTVVPNVNEGLNAIHSKGIIHKDIKPNNIFLSNDKGHVVIGDFGISSMMDSGLSVRMTTAARTVGYSAPETLFQRKLDDNSIGSKNTGYYMPASKEGDYYAFGITLLHLVLGRDPFLGMSEAQIIMHTSHYKLEIPPIPRLDKLIRGLTVKERQDRWGYEEIKRWINNEPVEVKENIEIRNDINPYIFEREKIYSLEDLAIKFAEVWDEAKKRIYRDVTLTEQFKQFIKQFGSDTISACLDYIEDVEDYDIGLFNIICTLNPDAPLCWKGEILGTLDSFFSTIINQSPNISKNYIDMLEKRIISKFLKKKNYPEDLINKVKIIEAIKDKEIAYFKLIYLLKTDISLYWRGEWFGDSISLSKAISTSDDEKKKNYYDLLKSGALAYFLKIKNNDEKLISKIESLQSESDRKWTLFKLIYILNTDESLYLSKRSEEIKDITILGNYIIQDQNNDNSYELKEIHDMLCSGALRCFLEEKRYDDKLIKKIIQLEEDVKYHRRTIEEGTLKLAYILDPKQKLFWRKEEIGDLEGLRESIKKVIPKINYDYIDLVKSGVLSSFLDIKGYNKEVIEAFREIESESNKELIYFKMVYLLVPDAPLIWGGKKFEKLEDISFTAGTELLRSGALYHYLETKGYDYEFVRAVKSLSNRADSESAFYRFQFLINPQEKFYYDKRYFDSLDELMIYLLEIGYREGIENIEKTLKKLQNNKRFSIWLEHLGYFKNPINSKIDINKIKI